MRHNDQRRRRRRSAGAAFILVLLVLPALLAVSAMVINVAYMELTRTGTDCSRRGDASRRVRVRSHAKHGSGLHRRTRHGRAQSGSRVQFAARQFRLDLRSCLSADGGQPLPVSARRHES